MNEFAGLICKYSQSDRRFLEILPDEDSFPPIENGIVFVFAAWSGPSIIQFSLLTGILKESPMTDLKIYVLDADRVDPKKFNRSETNILHGWGETFWVKDAETIHFLTKYGPQQKAEILAYTAELASGGSK